MRSHGAQDKTVVAACSDCLRVLGVAVSATSGKSEYSGKSSGSGDVDGWAVPSCGNDRDCGGRNMDLGSEGGNTGGGGRGGGGDGQQSCLPAAVIQEHQDGGKQEAKDRAANTPHNSAANISAKDTQIAPTVLALPSPPPSPPLARVGIASPPQPPAPPSAAVNWRLDQRPVAHGLSPRQIEAATDGADSQKSATSCI